MQLLHFADCDDHVRDRDDRDDDSGDADVVKQKENSQLSTQIIFVLTFGYL